MERHNMLGAICGDIVGSIYEWHNIKSKEFELFKGTCFFTDDTVMTVAIAKACMDYLENQDKEEFRKNCIFYMQLFGNRYPHAGYGGSFKNWLKDENPEAYNSYGNGSAMRVSPCGWIANSLEEAEELAKISAEVTHNHPEGIKGAKSIAGAIWLLRNGKSQEQVADYIQKNYYNIDFTIEAIRETYTFDVSCQGSVPQAIEAFLEASDFEDAIRNAISIGGDSDTIAAITGSLAEAYFGVPEKIKKKTLIYLSEDLKEVVKEFTDLKK